MRILSIVRRGLLLCSGLILLLGASGAASLVNGRVWAAGLALDKVVTGNQSTSATTVTSPTFTTSQAGELLVAFLASDGPGGTQTFSSVVNATGGSLTWTLRKRTNTQAGTAEIWTAVAPTILTGASVRGTHSGSYQASITVATFTGADLNAVGATGTGNARTGAPSAALTTTRAGSWVWGVGNDWDRAAARAVGANQTKVAEYLAPAGDTFWTQRQTNVTAGAGTAVTLSDTAPTNDRWNFSAIEILPAAVTAPDTTSPTAPAGVTATATSPTQVNVSWTASTDDTAVTGYNVLRDGTTIGTATGTTYSDGTALAGTTYGYVVRAFDAAGNVSADSNTATVTTPVPDTTAPVISTVSSSSVSQTTATISWQTDEAADTQVEYGTTVAYGSSTALNGTLATTHGQTLTGLSANTTYNFRVKSKDAAGNLAVSDNATFTTLPVPPDTTAPSVTITAPANGATLAGVITVSATAADDTAVAGVQFLLDGMPYGSEDTTAPYSTSWDTNTAATGSHTLAAIARDSAGNTTTSSAVSVTVNNTDLTAPSVAITSPANGTTVSGTVSVAATASDNVGVAGVQFRLDGVALGSEDTASPYNVSWNTTTATNGTHQLTAVARDATGNTTVSAVITVTVNNSVGGGTPLTIDGNQVFQTIDGFGVNANSASWNGTELVSTVDSLIDNGSRIWRVVIDDQDWEATNDNSDPNTYNWTAYNAIYSSAKFEKLWGMIAYLNSKGITNNVIICPMGKAAAWMGGGTLTTTETIKDEYAEMIASMAIYGHDTRGLQFTLEPNNEPDIDTEGVRMSGPLQAEELNKIAVRLDAAGLSSMRMMGPSAGVIQYAVAGFTDYMYNYPTLMAHVDAYSYHDYNGNTANAATLISNSPYPNKKFYMTEFSQFDDGMAMLSQGPQAMLVWDGYDSAYTHPLDRGGSSTAPNDAGDGPALFAYNSSTRTYTPRKEFYQFAQLFKYVPAGSQRIAATESNGNVTTYAFRQPQSNRTTIVGRNTGSAVTFNGTLANTSAVPSFEFYYTDWSGGANMQRGSDVTVTGSAFTFTAPANSVFTLTFAGNPDTEAPTAPTNVVANNTAPSQATLSWTASTDNVGVTGYDVYRSALAGFTPTAANKVGSTAGASFVDSGLPAGTYYYQVQARDAYGNLSPFSSEVSVNVLADTTPPTAPTNLTASGINANLVTLSWTASTDNVGVTSYNIWRDGVQIGTSTSTSYNDTTTTASTTYTYTVTAQDANGNVGAASNSAIATTPVTAPPVALDATTSFHQTSAATTISVPGVNTTGTNELLVAFISSDGPSGSGAQSFSSVTGGGLTWTLRKRTNTQAGTAEIWTAVASAQLTNATIVATRSGSYIGSITIASFKNANLTTIGATASASGGNGAPTVSLTATRTGSWVWGVANDWDSASSHTVGSNQVKVDEYLATSYGDSFWVQRQSSANNTAGTTVTLNSPSPTTDRWNFAAIEILPL